ncbi:MAG: hypothetical protein AAFV86_19595 [Pseudomonadota bacterium]
MTRFIDDLEIRPDQMPTREEIDRLTHRAHVMRGQAMADSLRGIARLLSLAVSRVRGHRALLDTIETRRAGKAIPH